MAGIHVGDMLIAVILIPAMLFHHFMFEYLYIGILLTSCGVRGSSSRFYVCMAYLDPVVRGLASGQMALLSRALSFAFTTFQVFAKASAIHYLAARISLLLVAMLDMALAAWTSRIRR